MLIIYRLAPRRDRPSIKIQMNRKKKKNVSFRRIEPARKRRNRNKLLVATRMYAYISLDIDTVFSPLILFQLRFPFFRTRFSRPLSTRLWFATNPKRIKRTSCKCKRYIKYPRALTITVVFYRRRPVKSVSGPPADVILLENTDRTCRGPPTERSRRRMIIKTEDYHGERVTCPARNIYTDDNNTLCIYIYICIRF